MFLNIFSVTLSEDFIVFLLHFTDPFRQVSITKPCILACRIRVLSAIRKEFLRCRFFFQPPLQAEKNGKKQTSSGIFAHTKTASGRSSDNPANRAEKTAAQPRRNLSVSLRNVITETVFQYRNPVRDSLPFRISVSIPDIRYTQPVLRTETAFQVRL